MSEHRRSKTSILVCSDANLTWQSAFVLNQAVNSVGTSDVQPIYCFSENPFSVYSKDIFPRDTIFLDANKYMRDNKFVRKAHVSGATMLRFYAIDALCQSFEKIIYLDSDVFIRSAVLDELVDLDLETMPVAGVLGRALWSNQPRLHYGRKYRQKLLGDSHDHYFNAGVMIINSQQYDDQEVTSRSLDFYYANSELCKFSDQSALNAVLKDNWLEVSPKWNWQMSTNSYAITDMVDPYIVHFTGPEKPWNDPLGLFSGYQDAYERFCEDVGLGADLPSRKRRMVDKAKQEKLREKYKPWFGDTDEKLEDFSNYLGRFERCGVTIDRFN